MSRRPPSAVLAVAVVCTLIDARAAPGEPPEIDALLDEMRAAYAPIREYTATFVKRERLGGKLGENQTIALKFRKPASVYMRWTEGKSAGREIVFVKGRNDDHALIHEPGVLAGLVTIAIAPGDPRVLKESRYPITDVGIGRLIDLVGSATRSATSVGTVRWAELPSAATSPGRATRRIEFSSAQPVEDCACQRAVVTVDVATRLPVAAEVFDASDQLLGRYEYTGLNTSPGLTDRDFDPANPGYGFPWIGR